jgi:transketolase
MTVTSTELDQLCINTIRALSIDAVQNANSGHPGTPLGIAPIVYLLWDRVMRYNPEDPSWPNRDRFVLSAGHACAVQYSVLFLTGYDVTLEDLTQFRQWGSKTPGHPEYGILPGIEVSTGPLGQGFAMSVGKAIAQKFLASRYNQPDFSILDHHTFVICSDGDLMEGISHEAASLAGTLRLDNIICIYDRNNVSIDGTTDITFDEDVAARFRAYGWYVQDGIDANDLKTLESALRNAQDQSDRPSLIIQDSHIGFASPLQDSNMSHGKPLGIDAVQQTKKSLGYPLTNPFAVPDEVISHMRKAIIRGRSARQEWGNLFASYEKKHPELATEFHTLLVNQQLPDNWDRDLPNFPQGKPLATRSASAKVMAVLASNIPTFLGGAADLATSVNTLLDKLGNFSAEDRTGRNIWFGVREQTMGAITNGMVLYGGVFPFTGTFLVFSDYMRPTLRLGALMGAPVTHVFTHDSIAVGEDGPSHQPVEHIAALRAIPNYCVIRPADANETREAWRAALLRRDGPTAIILTRQELPVLDRSYLGDPTGLHRGAYVLWETRNPPDLILIATGSEVSISLDAGRLLSSMGVGIRVVSMPSWELFAQQPQEYRDEILPPHVTTRLAIEAASPMGWHEWVGSLGDVIAVTTFGKSAPGNRVLQEYGFSVDNVIARAKALLKPVVP